MVCPARRSPRRLMVAGLCLVAFGLAGCHAVSNKASVNTNAGNQLTIYSSLPLQGPEAADSQAIVNGEKLALAQAQGAIGQFRISYESLDDTKPSAAGVWNPDVTSSNAKAAAQDNSTIAYLGDLDSGASAISLPLTNAASILQISPGSPYVGLTSSQDAGQDEPGRFYVNGQHTFGRLIPGDQVQAEAQAMLMHRLSVSNLYVINDQNPFELSLAELVAGDAHLQGVNVIADDGVSPDATDYSGEVHKVLASGADAVFFSGGAGPGSVRLWQQLAAADPHLILLGSDALANAAFTSAIGAAVAHTYLTTPQLPLSLYPAAARSVLREYARAFGIPASAPALYGYEAMNVTLQAIRAAGSRGNDRLAVVRAFFGIRDRRSVLGSYSVLASGDTTLSEYAVDRVVGGLPVFDFLLRPAPPAS